MKNIFKRLAFFLRDIFHINYIEQLIEKTNITVKDSFDLTINLKENITYLNSVIGAMKEELSSINSVINEQKDNINEILKVFNVRFELLNEKLNSYFRLIDEKFKVFPKQEITLSTDHPFAIYSDDFKYPRGARYDNTHHLRFVRKCEEIFGKKISYLDLGCAGGGLVLDFLCRGNFAIGLEGSDYPSKNLTGEWSLIDKYLFNCDITKEFKITDSKTGKIYKFDIIGLWEVFEHIPEELLPQLIKNIKKHLRKDGLLTASIATFKDEDENLKAVYHVNLKNKEWWLKFFERNGFEILEDLFEVKDFPRGSGNERALDWSAYENPELGFHVVAKLIGEEEQ